MKKSYVILLTAHSPKDSLVRIVNLLRKYTKHNLNIACPLSFLEHADKHEIGNLLEEGRLGLVNTFAYATKVAEIAPDVLQEEIILNEYAVAAHFGSNKSFDGEDLYMIKDLDFFVTPELSITPELVQILDGLGYHALLLPAAKSELLEIDNMSLRFVGSGLTSDAHIQLVTIDSNQALDDLNNLLADTEDAMLLHEHLDYLPLTTTTLEKLGIKKIEKIIFTNKHVDLLKGYENLNIWIDTEIEKIEDEAQKETVRSFMQAHRSLAKS